MGEIQRYENYIYRNNPQLRNNIGIITEDVILFGYT